LCEQVSVSLVINRQTPIYGATKRAALTEMFDEIVRRTGARVIVHPNTGAEVQPAFDCTLDPAWAGGEGFVWGEDFVTQDEAANRLNCALDGIYGSNSSGDADGDYMFSGLMFPILADNEWPPTGSDLHVAMMLSGNDDHQGGMYARPGMASEALVRLAGEGERDRVLALTLGTDADELSTFAVSVSADSRADDFGDGLDPALDGWADAVVDACARAEPIVLPAWSCERIDVLFVVDGSLSMEQERQALGDEAFAAFAERLEAGVDALEDFRVGVVSAQPGDILLHTHSQLPAVPPGTETTCGLDPRSPWLTGPSATLVEDFACLAATQASETTETTALNAALALDPATNPGFVRDDSLVAVVMVTDEDTQSAAVTRMEIRQRILDAVGGDLSRVVVSAVLGDQGIFEMPKTTCTGPYGTASPGRRLTSIVRSFQERGHTEDMCDDAGIAAAMDRIAAQIERACGA
jgi:hypothetical protein